MLRRFLSITIAALSALAPASVQEAGRLHKLCELWGGIKYFHPKLAYADIDWDKALVKAIAEVRLAKTSAEYEAAVSGLLRELRDPGSKVLPKTSSQPNPLRTKGEKFRVQDGILIFDIAASIDTVFGEGYEKLTQDLRNEALHAKGVIFDARPKDLTPLGAYRLRIAFLTYANLGLSGAVPTASKRTRQHLGFVPVTGTTSGGYVSSLNSHIPGVVEGIQPRAKPFVVIVDDSTPAPVYPLILGAQSIGQCAVVAESSAAFDTTSDLTEFDMGEGVTVTFPTSEVISTDGYLGFRPDKRAARNGTADAALIEALALAKSPIRQRPPGPAGLAAPRPLIERSYSEMVFPSVEYRLLALFRYWNVIRYFFPYLHLIGRDWNDVLDEAIPRFVSATDAREYAMAVKFVGAQIHDSHGFVNGPQMKDLDSDGYPALRTRYLDGKFIVTSLTESIRDKGISQGDELIEVDGVSPASRVEEQAKLTAYSLPSTAYYVYSPVAGAKGTVGKFKVKAADGVVRDIELARNNERPTILLPQRPQLPPYGVLPSGYGYIDLTRVQSSDIEPSLKALKDTPGLIFDMRGYPNATGWGYGAQLASQRVPIARFIKPDPELWSPTTGTPNGRVFVDSIDAAPGDKYKGKVVVLINYQAMSQAEHTCLILKAARPDTVFIGQTTAGANGDVTNMILPGGISMAFSGQAVTWVDGKQLQRVGVQPDIRVEPTAKGMLAGKDEILEAAIAHLSRNQPPPKPRLDPGPTANRP